MIQNTKERDTNYGVPPPPRRLVCGVGLSVAKSRVSEGRGRACAGYAAQLISQSLHAPNPEATAFFVCTAPQKFSISEKIPYFPARRFGQRLSCQQKKSHKQQ
ncbi:MAG: hypothetical protein LBQ31_04115 [Bacteroidales bacterium]|nr:hypothetical protein [Bacteroidales bacterium]